MGYAAVYALIEGKQNVMIGIVNKEITFTPFSKAIKHIEELNPDLIKMLDILSL